MVSKKIIIAGAVVVLGGGLLLGNSMAKKSIGENVEKALAQMQEKAPQGVKMTYEVTKDEEKGTFSGRLMVARDGIASVSNFNVEPSAFPLFDSSVKLSGDIAVRSVLNGDTSLIGKFETSVSAGQDDVKVTFNDIKGKFDGNSLGDTVYGVLGQKYTVESGSGTLEYNLTKGSYDAVLNAAKVDYSFKDGNGETHPINMKDVAIKYSSATEGNVDRSITAKELVNGDTKGKDFKLGFNSKSGGETTDVNFVFNGEFTNPSYEGADTYAIDVDFKKLDNRYLTKVFNNEISPMLTISGLFSNGVEIKINKVLVTNNKSSDKSFIEGTFNYKGGSALEDYELDGNANFDLKFSAPNKTFPSSLGSMLTNEMPKDGAYSFTFDGKTYKVNGNDDMHGGTFTMALSQILQYPSLFLENGLGVKASSALSVNGFSW